MHRTVDVAAASLLRALERRRLPGCAAPSRPDLEAPGSELPTYVLKAFATEPKRDSRFFRRSRGCFKGADEETYTEAASRTTLFFSYCQAELLTY